MPFINTNEKISPSLAYFIPLLSKDVQYYNQDWYPQWIFKWYLILVVLLKLFQTMNIRGESGSYWDFRGWHIPCSFQIQSYCRILKSTWTLLSCAYFPVIKLIYHGRICKRTIRDIIIKTTRMKAEELYEPIDMLIVFLYRLDPVPQQVGNNECSRRGLVHGLVQQKPPIFRKRSVHFKLEY